MIVDTSAIIAILKAEPERDSFLRTIAEQGPPVRLSAASYLEAAIVIDDKDELASSALDDLLADLEVEIVPVTAEQARLARQAHAAFGKRRHSARLNFGDCFVYALAKERSEPLLYKGNDFAQTDVIDATRLQT